MIVPPLYLGKDPVLLVAEHRLDGIIPHQRVRVEIPVPDDIVGGFGDELEAFIGRSYRALGLALIGHVNDDCHRGNHVAVGVAHRCRAHSDEPVRSVTALDANLFAANDFFCNHRSRQRPLDAGIAISVLVEPDPFVAVEIQCRPERRPEDLSHLRVDRDKPTRWNFGYRDTDRHLLLNGVRQRALRDQAELSVVSGSLGDASLNFRSDGEGERAQDIDVALGPVSWPLVQRTESAEDLSGGRLEWDPGVSPDAGPAIGELRLVPGIRYDERSATSDHVLTIAGLQRLPAVALVAARATNALEIQSSLVDKRDEDCRDAEYLRGEPGKAIEYLFGGRVEKACVIKSGERVGARESLFVGHA